MFLEGKLIERFHCIVAPPTAATATGLLAGTDLSAVVDETGLTTWGVMGLPAVVGLLFGIGVGGVFMCKTVIK